MTAVLFLLSACGFRLAGDRSLPEPLKNVYIDYQQHFRVSEPPLMPALRTRVTRRGGVVSGKLNGSSAILRLSDLRESREVLSVGTTAGVDVGKAVEYRLTVSVRYQLIGNERVLVAPDVLTVSRDYSFNATQVLAKEAEEARLRDYIQNEMADLIFLRLEARLKTAELEVAPDVAPAP